MTKIKFKMAKGCDWLKPVQFHKGDSGWDVKTANTQMLGPWETKKMRTGVFLEMPEGYECQVRPKSGKSLDNLVADFGTVDGPYRGEICVILHNRSAEGRLVTIGTNIAQLVFQKIPEVALVEVEELSETTRGAGGFGSTQHKEPIKHD